MAFQQCTIQVSKPSYTRTFKVWTTTLGIGCSICCQDSIWLSLAFAMDKTACNGKPFALEYANVSNENTLLAPENEAKTTIIGILNVSQLWRELPSLIKITRKCRETMSLSSITFINESSPQIKRLYSVHFDDVCRFHVSRTSVGAFRAPHMFPFSCFII